MHWFIDDLYQLCREPLFKALVIFMLVFSLISLSIAISINNYNEEMAQCRRAERRLAEAAEFFRKGERQ